MDHAMRMQVLECTHYLERVALNLQLVQALPPLEQVVERLVLANLEQDVDILGVLKEVLELADLGVLQTSVDFDLRHQLLFGA